MNNSKGSARSAVFLSAPAIFLGLVSWSCIYIFLSRALRTGAPLGSSIRYRASQETAVFEQDHLSRSSGWRGADKRSEKHTPPPHPPGRFLCANGSSGVPIRFS